MVLVTECKIKTQKNVKEKKNLIIKGVNKTRKEQKNNQIKHQNK